MKAIRFLCLAVLVLILLMQLPFILEFAREYFLSNGYANGEIALLCLVADLTIFIINILLIVVTIKAIIRRDFSVQ